ncbi:MAG: tetratricopeptide repeat protein [Novosphingobium sp.]|uniref:tetratricopeptide repeat protein n=1 Tax=Novosphingobium sp. TaxID=1874826 RepID=UPI0032BAEB41
MMKQLLSKKRPLAALIAMVIAAPALAQSGTDLEGRLRKLEAEVAAIQRTVFPGGDPRYFPQLQTGQPAASAPGTPATTPGADMLARMDALEGQVARLTAQVEEDHNRLEKAEARLAALEAGAKAAPAAIPAAGAASQTNLAAMSGPAASSPAPKPAATSSAASAKPAQAKPATADGSAKRLAAVRAVPKPKTQDPGDDEYSYGFRLFEASFYPESQQQLKLFLQKYPKHSRTSYARNLLGRAYLEDGNPREAAGWFLQNYKTEPKGARGPDSLLNLAEAMRQLNDKDRACVAIDSFRSEYPAEAAGRLKPQYDATRARLKCN